MDETMGIRVLLENKFENILRQNYFVENLPTLLTALNVREFPEPFPIL